MRARRFFIAGSFTAAVAFAGCHDFSQVKFGTDTAGGGAGGGPSAGGGAGGAAGAAAMRPLPPSCQGTPAPTCGTDSCCDPAQTVPAITGFLRGYDRSPDRDIQNGKPIVGWQAMDAGPGVLVDAFILDKYEVTVGRFRGFYAGYDAILGSVPMDGAGAHPKVPGSGWSKDWSNANNASPGTYYAPNQTALRAALGAGCSASGAADRLAWLDDPARTNDARPMTCVTWYEAFLFCIWDQGRLPTEAEWNVAAAGGQQYRAYPWNSADDPGALAVAFSNGYIGIGQPIAFPPTFVGMLPAGAGRWGHMDLAGNAYEYVRDRADQTMAGKYTDATSNPIQLTGPNLIARGGSFKFDELRARTSYRNLLIPDVGAQSPQAFRFDDVGWRCARTP